MFKKNLKLLLMSYLMHTAIQKFGVKIFFFFFNYIFIQQE